MQILSFIFSNFASPMPLTLLMSSMAVKAPSVSRNSMMRSDGALGHGRTDAGQRVELFGAGRVDVDSS